MNLFVITGGAPGVGKSGFLASLRSLFRKHWKRATCRHDDFVEVSDGYRIGKQCVKCKQVIYNDWLDP